MKSILSSILSTILIFSITSASYASNEARVQDAIKRQTAAMAQEVHTARTATLKRAILSRHLQSIVERSDDLAADGSATVNGRKITVDSSSQATIQQLNVLAVEYLAALNSVEDQELDEFANSLSNEFQKAFLYVLSILGAIGLGVYLLAWITSGIAVVY